MSKIKQIIKERGNVVVKNFERVIFSGIQNKKIITIFEDVKEIYRDTYRPALISISCEAVGGNPKDTYEIGLMVTLAGAGIGIHDDIIDKATNKHFRITIPGKYNLDEALVVGDLLIVKGLLAVKETFKNKYCANKLKRVLETYQDFFFEVCDGVFLEKEFFKCININLDTYHQILWKLGSDAQACAKLGAILGNGTKKEIEILSDFGRKLGYIFRLSEEVNDTLNKEGNLPKRLSYETVPLPIVYAAHFSRENYLTINQILKNPITSEEIKKILDLCFETKSFEYVRDQAEKIVKEAIETLNRLKRNEAIELLIMMIEDMYMPIDNAFKI